MRSRSGVRRRELSAAGWLYDSIERTREVARANIGKIARGDIAVTGAYNLKAKYIIHTVGPVWTDGLHHEFEILKHFMESRLC